MSKTLYLIVPCYNEKEIIKKSAKALKEKMENLINKKEISRKSKIVFVNDGSRDTTLEIIKSMIKNDSIFICVNLTCNTGHQNALLAGLDYSKDKCDMSISLDADLQDDINSIDEMIKLYYQGNDVVYGVRNNRKTDSLFKKTTAKVYYKIIKKMNKNMIYNHADFRLLSKAAMIEIFNYPDANMYLRGLIPSLKFKSSNVYYSRKKRELGKSKYSINKMLKLAIDGLTNFSIVPIRFFTIFGIILSLVNLLIVIVVSMLYCAGITKNLNIILFLITFLLISIVILGIGLIGEYIGNIMLDLKNRPKYRIEEIIKNDK